MSTSLPKLPPSLYVLIAIFVIAITSAEVLASPNIIATIEPYKRVVLSAEVSGVVSSAAAEIGDNIQAGQNLGRLAADDYALNVKLTQALLELSEAEFTASKNQFERLKQLYANKSISTSQHEKQKSMFDISKSQLLVNKIKYWMAKSSLDKTQIKAPFSGVISARYIEQGQLLNVGDPIFEMVSVDQVKVVFYLLETDFMQLKKSDKVNVNIDAVNTQQYTATIIGIAPAQSGTRAGYRVEALLNNKTGLIKPGFTARVTLPNEKKLATDGRLLIRKNNGV